MGHCKSKLKQCNAVAQANKTKEKKYKSPHHSFNPQKYSSAAVFSGNYTTEL